MGAADLITLAATRRVTVATHALVAARPVEHFEADARLSIGQIIRTLAQRPEDEPIPTAVAEHVQVFIESGRAVPATEWDLAALPPGSPVLVFVVPAGGGFKKVAGLMAMIAVAWAAPHIAAWLAPSLFSTTATGAIVANGLAGTALTAGIGAVGALAVGAIFKPTLPSAASGSNDPRSYVLAGQSNDTAPYQPVPRLYGRLRYAPRVVAVGRSVIRGGKQYLQAIYSAGYGPLDVDMESMRAGDTPLSSLADVRVKVHPDYRAGDPLEIYLNDTAVTSLDITMEMAGSPYYTAASSKDAQQITANFTWPGGLVNYNPKSGGKRNRHVRINGDIRDVTANGAWQPIGNFAPRVDLSKDFVHAPGLGPHWVEFVGQTDKLLQAAITFDLPHASVWEIRLCYTVGSFSEDGNNSDAIVWTSLQSYADRPPIAPDVPQTIIELEVAAQEQAQNALQTFTAIFTSRLRQWNGSAFTEPVATRNPAWIYLDLLTGAANPRALKPERVALDRIAAWAAYCDRTAPNADEAYAMCDVLMAEQTTVWEAMKIPLACGRASYAMHDGRHSVLMEEAERAPVQMFTEINSRNFSAVRAYRKMPHGFKAKFVDPDSDWQQRDLPVLRDEFDDESATEFEDLTLTGVTRSSQAWRDGRYFLAEALLRQETVTIEVDIEHLACSRGDLVYVAHDVLMAGGVPAYVVAVPDDRTLDLGLNVPSLAGRAARAPRAGIEWGEFIWGQMAWGEGAETIGTPGWGEFRWGEVPWGGSTEPVGLALRVRAGREVGPQIGVVKKLGDRFECAAPHGAQVGDLVVWGYLNREVASYLVSEIRPGVDLTAELTLVEHAPAIYTADTGPIPPYTPQISGRPVTTPVAPPTFFTALVNYYTENGLPWAAIVLDWSPSTTAGVVGYRVAHLFDGAWIQLAEQRETGFRFGPVALMDLPAEREYTFRVSVLTEAGAGAERTISASIDPAGQRPDAPSGLIARNTRDGIEVSWNRVPRPGVVAYRVTIAAESDPASVLEERVTSDFIATLGFRDTGRYTVAVVSIDAAGLESKPASIALEVQAPPAPTGLSLNWSADGLRIDWTQPESSRIAYWLVSVGSVITEAQVFAASYVARGISGSSAHRVSVWAVDWSGARSAAAVLDYTPGTVPAPADFAVAVGNDGTRQFSWRYTATPQTALFELRYAPGALPSGDAAWLANSTVLATVAVADSGQTAWGFESMQPPGPATYSFSVRARDKAGVWSAPAYVNNRYLPEPGTAKPPANSEFIEVRSSLPDFNGWTGGKLIYLTTDRKLYRWTPTGWTRATDGSDITPSSITTDKLQVGNLSGVSANLGHITSGELEITGDGFTGWGSVRSAGKWWGDGKVGWSLAYNGAEGATFLDLQGPQQRIWFSSWGECGISFGNGRFSVAQDGYLYATGAHIRGDIEATSVTADTITTNMIKGNAATQIVSGAAQNLWIDCVGGRPVMVIATFSIGGAGKDPTWFRPVHLLWDDVKQVSTNEFWGYSQSETQTLSFTLIPPAGVHKASLSADAGNEYFGKVSLSIFEGRR